MPTYDYQCQKCQHEMEVFQSMSDDALTQCPQCGEEGLKRLVGGGLGVIFKGSGFYVNDSKSSNAASPKNANKGKSTSEKKKAKDTKAS